MKTKQETNQTAVTEFILLGFQGSRTFRIVFFFLLLVTYCATLYGNLLIITLVFYSKSLRSPMYFFISQLSMNDILLSTDIVPNMLYIQCTDRAAITFSACITQFYFFGTAETFECLLLTVMSYDRYLAICNPLRYHSIMDNTYSRTLVAITWMISLLVILINTITISQLSFCKSNIIDHVFCDLAPLLEISCSDPYLVLLEAYVQIVPVVMLPCIMIVVSYCYIFYNISQIQSNFGRHKAFSTCSSHLLVVSLFYGSLFSVYVSPMNKESISTSKVTSLLYTVYTPLLNPIIYSLRNKDIKVLLYKTMGKIPPE